VRCLRRRAAWPRPLAGAPRGRGTGARVPCNRAHGTGEGGAGEWIMCRAWEMGGGGKGGGTCPVADSVEVFMCYL